MRVRFVIASFAAAVLAAAATTPSSADAGDDSDLRRAVRDQIRLSPVVGRLGIDVKARDGTVTLVGRVDTLYEAWEAIHRAGEARGAIDVESRLEIGGGSRDDGTIESEILRNFSNILGVAEAGLGVTVRGGVATIEGKLRDARVRFQAADAAARVVGVVEVVDRVETGERDDEDLLKSVEAVIGRRSLVRVSGLVEVQVEQGVVTLAGTVSRFSEKRRARELVLGVNGVKEVVDRLEVTRKSPNLLIQLD